MAAYPSPPGKMRLLLVSLDPALIDATKHAASLLAAPLDILPTLDSALAWLLHPVPTCTHLLAQADLPPADIDALGGMLDEVTDGAATLFVLGATRSDGRSVVGINPCGAASIAEALRAHPYGSPPTQPPLDAEGLRAALHEGRLRMHFQPVLDARTLRMTGVEALARLHHPTLGILRPGQFMPLAVASGQERTLSNVAAARAMMELRGRPFMRGRRVSFNLPMSSFLHDFTPARALEICAIADLPPQRAVIELVESSDPPHLAEITAALARWRDTGFSVSIDDAGPRLPHWRALLNLPFSAVKLDGSLAGPAPDAGALASDIVAAARRQGLFVVAEGIEDAAARERMRALGVDALQGFLFCRPVPARALQLWSEAWEALVGKEVLF